MKDQRNDKTLSLEERRKILICDLWWQREEDECGQQQEGKGGFLRLLLRKIGECKRVWERGIYNRKGIGREGGWNGK